MDSNLFWCIASIIGGAISSLIISSFFYFLGLKRIRISYKIKTCCIIPDKINEIKELKVKYKDFSINNLYLSTIFIKNIGNTIIEPTDFVYSDQLGFITNGNFLTNEIKFLSSNITHQVCPTFKSERNSNVYNTILLNFDCISKKEEISCLLIHTGEISLIGTLKDGKRINIRKHKQNFLTLFKILSIIAGLIISVITYSGFSNMLTSIIIYLLGINSILDIFQRLLFDE